MKITGFRTQVLRHGRGEGHHVMFHFGLDLGDALQVEPRALAHGAGRLGGNLPVLGQNLRRRKLHLQPGAKFVFLGPDLGHLRACVARDQREYLKIETPPSVPSAS